MVELKILVKLETSLVLLGAVTAIRPPNDVITAALNKSCYHWYGPDDRYNLKLVTYLDDN